MDPHENVRSGPLITVLVIGGILGSLTQTIVVPLIAQLPAIFDTTPSNASWIITVTLLTAAVSTPIVGRLADMYGKKRMLLIALLPLVIGSALCALSTSLAPMIVGRALQGLATGTIPLGVSVLHELLPPRKVPGAVALTSASLGVGGAVGLPIAAAVAQFATWRVMFASVATLALLVIVAMWLVIPARRDAQAPAPPARRRFDYLGALLLAAGLVALLLGVSKGNEWGWASAVVVALLVGAVVVLALWGWWELRTPHAMIDLRATARRPVLLTNIASVLVGFAMFAQSLIVPQLMQLPAETGYGHGQSMLQMGLWMAPTGIAMMALSPLGARLTRARGPRTTLIVGSAIIAAGYALSTLLAGSLVALAVTSSIVSAGVGFAYGAMPAVIMAATPASDRAAANSFNSLMRSFGTATSGAVIGVVLAQFSVVVAGHAVPTFDGIRLGLLIGSGVAVGAAVLAAFLPRPAR
ncbi:MFS transporter [Microbacterium sp. No. 7]|uniref:MFS transporter n=1 Tax=Microbacterium sp. No. 7 TaxID=1714373 RepID=UPI0006CF8449|nr:MFS transporter [Microbacterium sp. No. 7]ALJ18500.1 MFS transporter permease [Microbacterium sp. No. 7]